MPNIAGKLKELRLQAGLTQGQLADKLGVDQATISTVELGRRNPSLPLLDKWLEFFQVQINIIDGAIVLRPEEELLVKATRALPPEKRQLLTRIALALTQMDPFATSLLGDLISRSEATFSKSKPT